MRMLSLSGGPSARGRIHGSRLGEEIREYAADRIALSAVGTDLGRDALIELAERCLPAHEAYAPDLYEEMAAMAEEAGLSPAEAVIVGGYTDFIDLVRAKAGGGPTEDNCTAVIVPEGVADGPGYLAQTWDMHASATPRVLMLRIEPDRGPQALVFTTMGCLGQIGMNEAGVAVGINNLTAADGRVGVTWPFVVRRALQQSSAEAAIATILEAELAGGHSFLVFDRDGRGATVEAMPTASRVTELGSEPLVHTNHCLLPETRTVEGARPADLQESSLRRLADASDLLGVRPVTVETLMAMTRDTGAICRKGASPADYESCGAAIMRPGTGDFWAVAGVPSENEYEHFVFERSRT